ncbi:electron transfer flavoprotein beta subunit lysine methyltransferase-like isoform X1 [Hylaeus volcanicus]|uniref:electron transfer flavoprotein beta subunit lysine methyltransferase-like isoform X1 n=1 Tax=Hylaeus volcanicus TaxID=313075 RepID=UPI0023B8647C|nr:electron transfer flavoprotein beta subunit lysine methyltransferase-like isoform X1 [Hylaeus volcanicus]XP_053981571.1 electron transfer flavoprotein beta subunit lysine methyltransferase-like isoform X1 [Hylaeus volcanicus]
MLARASRLRRYRECGVMTEAWKRVTGDLYEPAVEQVLRLEPRTVEAILNGTEITRDHMTPEIKLFLLTPNCALYRAPFRDVSEKNETARNVFSDPFWSIYWPGGQALARFVLDEGQKLFSTSRKDGGRILDVGAGCGAVAIAAKLMGARKVVANDIDKVACAAIAMNAALNHVDVQVSQENLLHRPPEKPNDVIFVGDMLYDEEIAAVLIPWLELARTNGTRIYLSDPGRHGLTTDLKKRLKPLRRYSLPENVRKENFGHDTCDIWEFCGTRVNHS